PITVPVDALDVVVERGLESVKLSHGVVEYLEGVGQRGGHGARQPHVLELRPDLQQTATIKQISPPPVPLPISVEGRSSSVHVVVRGEERAAMHTQRLTDSESVSRSRARFSGFRMISTKTEMGGSEEEDGEGTSEA
ncbi:hypothetical protein PENTCL1PPCAC_4282, partial [Pristionchus entomophagus]